MPPHRVAARAAVASLGFAPARPGRSLAIPRMGSHESRRSEISEIASAQAHTNALPFPMARLWRTFSNGSRPAAGLLAMTDMPSERKIALRGTTLAVREKGEGPPLLWGHGLLASMTQEDELGVLECSALAGIRLIRYDARGHGRSAPCREAAALRWPELAADELALADALGLERTALGGVSMGAATALHAAVTAPERTTALVLVGPPTAWAGRVRQARLYGLGAAVVETLGTLAPLGWLGRLRPWGRRADTLLDRMRRAALHHLPDADPGSVAAALRGASASDYPPAEALARLAVPAAIFAWPGDPIHPLETAQRLASLLPDAEIHVAEDLSSVGRWPDRVRSLLERSRSPKEAVGA